MLFFVHDEWRQSYYDVEMRPYDMYVYCMVMMTKGYSCAAEVCQKNGACPICRQPFRMDELIHAFGTTIVVLENRNVEELQYVIMVVVVTC